MSARTILLRMVKAIAVLFAVAVFSFVLIRMAPGDPATVMAGEQGAVDVDFLDHIRERYGLDRPVHEQLALYIGRVATLDFGMSYRFNRPVIDLIAERLVATLILTISSFLIALVAGVALGALAARHAGRWQDTVISATALLFFALPLFWVGLMGILVFSVWLGWLPAFGMTRVGVVSSTYGYVLDIARHLVLPAFTLALVYIATYTRMTRASILEVMDLDFVRTAYSKGLGSGRVWRRHILRNAMLPIITLASLQAGHLVGGAVLTETVFAWPGIGRLAFDALLQRDYNLLLAVFIIASALVVFFNFVADVLYGIVDPRIGSNT